MSYTFRKVVGDSLKSFGYQEFNRPRMHQNVFQTKGWKNTTTVFCFYSFGRQREEAWKQFRGERFVTTGGRLATQDTPEW